MKMTVWILSAILGWLAFIPAAQGITHDEFSGKLRAYLIAADGSLAASAVPSGILYDLAMPLSPISALNGSDSCGVVATGEWLQVCHELHRAALDSLAMPRPQEFRRMANENAPMHVYPIALLNYNYQRIRDGWRPDSVLHMIGTEIVTVDRRGLETRRVFAAAALKSKTYRGGNVQFHLDSRHLYFSNSGLPIAKISVDFDDGRGFHRAPLTGDVTANYASSGKKTVHVRVTLTDGSVQQAKFTFEVIALTTPNPTETWPIQAGIPYSGRASTGEAYVYLAPDHTVLTKPVIVSEGFDLDNSMFWDELYALLNQQNLLETLRSLGYDAVVLNYDSATTYIQRNAYLMETLLDSVNVHVGGQQTSVLIGPSMGGLTTRYALAHMEQMNHPHHIRKLITLDAPHRGANIPLGIQYWVDFFADQSTDAALLRDALNSPAARQLLVVHYTSPSSTTPSADPARAALLNDFIQIGGFPTQPRLVAVANGSGYRQGLDFDPGAQLIRYQYNSLLLDITGNVWALHNTHLQQIFNGILDLIWPLPDTRKAVTVQPTWPWDNAPGGTRNSMAEMDSVTAPYGDITALHPSHCFIPTISALDIATDDPFYNIAGDLNLYAHTPFDSLYFPADNQGHVDITEESFWWFIIEIVDSLTAPKVTVTIENGLPRLAWSPVPVARSYHIFNSSSAQSWPGTYVATTDTTWIDSDMTISPKFYRIIASAALPTFASGTDERQRRPR
jgi:pimeloyl-ACP methyl ester carboxylesterase